MIHDLIYCKILCINGLELIYSTRNVNVTIGNIVLVQIRNKLVIGVIIELIKNELFNFEIKNISTIIENYTLSLNILQFIDTASNYCLIAKNILLKMILGPFVKRYETLIKKKQHIKHNHFIYQEIILSLEQQKIFDELSKLQSGVSVLNGLTGSGKTELYLKLAQYASRQNYQVLILLPEILLTTQIIERAKVFFTSECWHSQVSQKNKDTIWLNVYHGNTNIIIGTRSALFLPFNNLKLIIMDEEHDSSFKQENSPIYHARDLALIRSKNISLLLTSATPCIETLYNVYNKNYQYYYLNSRYYKEARVKIEIINMWESYDRIKKLHSIFHLKTLEQIRVALQHKKQSIIFLNRKGYANTILCQSCMLPIKCKNCNVKLTFYKNRNEMKCRHCHYTIKEMCTTCNSKDFLFYQYYGVEKIQEYIQSLFVDARILVVTSDAKEEDVIHKIVDHQYDIIIGTQILAKGLHFSNIALCVVINANDVKLGGDIRAFEKTYQIIQQVIGRIGRENNGLAIVQTFHPQSELIQKIAQNDTEGFLKLELQQRYITQSPPYTTLILINISSINESLLIKWLKNINLPYKTNIKIFGPFAALLYKLHNRYRYQILFKGDTSIRFIVKEWIDKLSIPKSIRIIIDTHPINFN